MKTKNFLLITLVLVSFQVWGSTADSLKINASSWDFIDKSKGYERLDDLTTTDGLTPDGEVFDLSDLVNDLVIPGQTTETTSSTTSGSQATSSAPIIATLFFYCPSYQYIKISAKNITSSLKLSIRGTGRSYFTVTPKCISAANARKGIYVKVTCNPTSALQRATAYLDVYYAGTVISTFRLSYVKNQMPRINSVEPEFDNDPIVEAESMDNASPEAWGASSTGMNELSVNSKVYAEGQNVVIESSVDQRAIISDLTGRAQTVNLQVGRNEIPVNASGIYIVRIGEKTTKLILR